MQGLLHDEFFEIGASGRRWNRADTLAALLARSDDEPVPAVSEMAGIRLAEDVVLVTYLTQQGAGRCRRSSLWRRPSAGWRRYFHQGTVVPAGS